MKEKRVILYSIINERLPTLVDRERFPEKKCPVFSLFLLFFSFFLSQTPAFYLLYFLQ